MAKPSNDLTRRTGQVRTDLHCTHCEKNFVATIDYDIDGNHIIECPYCTHEHCRVIQGGVVTSDRWSSRMQRVDVKPRSAWSHQSLPVKTTVVSEFLRDRWLNRSDSGSTSD